MRTEETQRLFEAGLLLNSAHRGASSDLGWRTAPGRRFCNALEQGRRGADV